MYFLGVSSSRNKGKKCVKNEKKKRKEEDAEPEMGYCPTVSRYNGKLYRDIVVGGMQLKGKHVTIQFDCIVTGVGRLGWGLCRNTRSCIVTEEQGLAAEESCHDTKLYCDSGAVRCGHWLCRNTTQPCHDTTMQGARQGLRHDRLGLQQGQASCDTAAAGPRYGPTRVA